MKYVQGSESFYHGLRREGSAKDIFVGEVSAYIMQWRKNM
jgi:hypothetical protein